MTPLSQLGVRAPELAKDSQCAVDRSNRLVCAGGEERAGTRIVKTKLLTFSTAEGFAESTSIFQVRGQDHACGRTRAGKVLCFRLSSQSVAKVPSPTVDALSDIIQVDGGGVGDYGIACALAKNGRVSCWGNGRWGQLGKVPPVEPFEAVSIAELPPVTRLAVGGMFVCALTRAGEVYCWGSNRSGTAPDGQRGERQEAIPIVLPQR